MDQNETQAKPLSPIMMFNVFNGLTNEQLNSKPLTQDEAIAYTQQIHESDAAAPLVIRSNRSILME